MRNLIVSKFTKKGRCQEVQSVPKLTGHFLVLHSTQCISLRTKFQLNSKVPRSKKNRQFLSQQEENRIGLQIGQKVHEEVSLTSLWRGENLKLFPTHCNWHTLCGTWNFQEQSVSNSLKQNKNEKISNKSSQRELSKLASHMKNEKPLRKLKLKIKISDCPVNF